MTLIDLQRPASLQAAIAACHARATSADETNWQRITALYSALSQLVPSPVVELNRAVAISMAFGPAAGLALVDTLREERALENYHLLPSVRGDLLSKLERYDEALAWYANVPGEEVQGIARLRSANVMFQLQRKQQAFDALRAIQSDATLEEEGQRDAYLLEAELRLKDKDAAGELDAYARGLAAFADDQALLYSRALLWERRDDIAKAEADFRRILVASPDDVNALNALGYTLADRTDRYKEALELIDRARVAEPGNAAIIDSYGWVLFRLGKTREALGHLRHAFALQKDADIASHLGQVLWVLGEKEEARKYFDEARKIDPENRALQRALKDVGA